MTIFETINNLPILEVLDAFGIGYTKNGTGYVILKDDGRKDESFSISIQDNIVKDFGKTQIQGGPFDFIGRYILKEDTQTTIGKANTVKLFIEKGLVQAPDQQKTFTPSLKDKELLEQFDNFKLNGYKKEISAFLLTRGVPFDFITKNEVKIGELFKDIGYYNNYFCPEYETYKDESSGQWIVKPGDEAKNVAVFMFPCYNQLGDLIGMKLRRKDGKTIRGKKSVAVGKTGLLYDTIDTNSVIIVEGETDYLILKLLGYESVVGNLGGVDSGRSMLKSLLAETSKVICLYDNDEAGEKGKHKLAEVFGRQVYGIEYPVREDKNGVKLSDVNDFYNAGYDSKTKWDKILSTAEVIGKDIDQKISSEFIYIRKDLQFYDTKAKIFQDAGRLANYLLHTGKELSKLVKDNIIPEFWDLCYYAGGKPDCYNTLNESSIITNGGEAPPELHPEIEYLINNICNKKKANIEWIHQAILYKITHLNDVHVPALILYGAGGSGKGTFLNLLSKIFGAENTQIGLGQKDLKSSFDTYQGEKLIVEFKEVSSNNRHDDKITMDYIKSFVGEPIITVRAKYQNAKQVDNIAWFHLSSNHPVPLQLDSKHSGNRRWAVIKTGGALDPIRAEYLNHTILKDKEVIKSYVNWLYDTYPEIPGLTKMFNLDNEEKANLEENCESVTNQFFEWLELKYPYIRKITVLEKNLLIDKYCTEVGEDKFDIKFKQSNFDLGLSHRFEKKIININGKSIRGYYINKTDFELQNMPEGKLSHFTDELDTIGKFGMTDPFK